MCGYRRVRMGFFVIGALVGGLEVAGVLERSWGVGLGVCGVVGSTSISLGALAAA